MAEKEKRSVVGYRLVVWLLKCHRKLIADAEAQKTICQFQSHLLPQDRTFWLALKNCPQIGLKAQKKVYGF